MFMKSMMDPRSALCLLLYMTPGEREGRGVRGAGEEWQESEGVDRGVRGRGMRGRSWGVTGEGRGGRCRKEE